MKHNEEEKLNGKFFPGGRDRLREAGGPCRNS